MSANTITLGGQTYTIPTPEDALRNILPAGTTVQVVVRHVAASGMTRWMSLFVVVEGGYLMNITKDCADLLGEKTHNRDGANTIKVGGCGMDMTAHLVSRVAKALHGDDYALRARCI